MQSYLEVKVPIRVDSKWYKDLKRSLSDIPVRWQSGYFHITLSFLNETAGTYDVVSVIDDHMKSLRIPNLTFDKLDVFTAKTAGMHIVNLTVSEIPDSFKQWVDSLRVDLTKCGCVMESEFRLHVTLGRVDSVRYNLNDLQPSIAEVNMPSFKLPLCSYEYRAFRGETIKTWNLVNN